MMIRARLTNRYGAFVGYCDVPEQYAKNLPALPEVISLRFGDRSAPAGRTFVRDSLGDAETSRSVVPSYREATFDWGENFRGTAVPIETPRPAASGGGES